MWYHPSAPDLAELYQKNVCRLQGGTPKQRQEAHMRDEQERRKRQLMVPSRYLTPAPPPEPSP